MNNNKKVEALKKFVETQDEADIQKSRFEMWAAADALGPTLEDAKKEASKLDLEKIKKIFKKTSK